MRIDHATVSDRAVLLIITWAGTREGGAFEIAKVGVFEIDDLGRIRCIDQYDLDQVDAARARFAELVLGPVEALRPDPLRILPNAASLARDRALEAFAARDWLALRALTSRDMVWEDRQKRALLTGDVELWISSLQTVSPWVRFEHELIATVGDRVALEHVGWVGGPKGGEFQIEQITLTEVDADGRIRASITFDLDDRRAAFAEAHARFVAGEAAAIGGQTPIVVLARAFARRNWETLRGCLADNLVFRDHRTLGLLGELRRDEWVESLRVQTDLAPDVDVETLRVITWNTHGRVDLSRAYGILRDGGPFENVMLRVIVTDGDHIRHWDLFEVGDGERALARLEELCVECAQP
ncbi:MAG: nuclear transport factor 2 family protein [Deltaproteobacteria bacterium]|nr:nuclear transport factor 2 family protein [Deltaproteobacteria bacterium]MBI3389073.1 nuclear transport factor 2 family protein [Deltaproteobacteria bacterium]